MPGSCECKFVALMSDIVSKVKVRAILILVIIRAFLFGVFSQCLQNGYGIFAIRWKFLVHWMWAFLTGCSVSVRYIHCIRNTLFQEVIQERTSPLLHAECLYPTILCNMIHQSNIFRRIHALNHRNNCLYKHFRLTT